MLALVVLLISVVAPGAAAQATGDGQLGKAIYEKRCKACHGAFGQGNPAVARAMKGELNDLRSKEVQSKSNDDLKKDILGGYGKKKPVKLTDKEVEDVTAFVRTMGKK